VDRRFSSSASRWAGPRAPSPNPPPHPHPALAPNLHLPPCLQELTCIWFSIVEQEQEEDEEEEEEEW